MPILLFALWLLTDNETSDSNKSHHLAVFTALRRHPPCLRVYRSLLELNLLLWCAVLSLLLWSRTVGKKMIGHLLFQPAGELIKNSRFSDATSFRYLPVHGNDIFDEDDAGLERDQISEIEMMDAQYDSDGSIPEPPPFVVYEPPAVETVAGVALDSLILILVSLFFFTLSSAEGGRYVDGMATLHTFRFMALVTAPIFPLLLFAGGVFYGLIPWHRRKEFWKIVSFTIGAPFYHVTFRDGFIGDIITSMVRPLQDIAFTSFYFFSGLQGWWQQSYVLDSADLPLEKNWLLHTCILPMCMASPLWWRFLQNLRQCYENKQRWPYLGNALKYFVAAEVAIFGVMDPSRKQSFLWLSCFAGATLYQIWWDVFMDWELFIVNGSGIQLRKTRIYSVRWLYWAIFVINFVLRFCWTLSFLPPHYLNRAGVLSETFDGDLPNILNPIIASAEIIRRTLWGFLRVELEAIKVGRKDARLKGAWSDGLQDREIELQVIAMEGMAPVTRASRTSVWWLSSDMSSMSDLQLLGELAVYATAFTSLGMVATAHRLTL